MSKQHQETLIADLVENQPTLNKLVKERSGDLIAGSWDLVSYSFQRGFEELWDVAQISHNGLLTRPLLSLWRQSIELALKSTILTLENPIEGKANHDLNSLFQKLLTLSGEAGLCHDNDLTRNIDGMIRQVQLFDPLADRFRYPSNRKGILYKGFDVDLDKLFQAHWAIVTWCEGVQVILGEKYGIGEP